MDTLTPESRSNQHMTCCSKSPLASASASKNTTLSPLHDDHKPSSYSSSASSSSDSKIPKCKAARELKTSRGFLNCIGKHLGCPFLQQTSRQLPQQQRYPYIYNSQDDLPSSSTDSFSLSYEHASHLGFHLTGSNIDLTYNAADNLAHQSNVQSKQHTHRQPHSQHASRNTLSSSAYSGSSYSPAFCSFEVDCLVDAYNGDRDDEEDVCTSLKMYHHQHHSSDAHVAHSCSSSEHNSDTNSSDEDDECSTHEECCEQQQKRKNKHEQLQQLHSDQHQHQQKQSSSTHRRLHLSRLSIASSVTRMLNHFASSTSMRSLSCSSTPLRCFKDAKPKEADDVVHLNDRNKNEAKKHSLPNTSSASSNGSRSSSSGSSSSGSGSGSGSSSGSSGSSNRSLNNNNNNRSSSSNASNGKKKEKKQQSILRPPVHYVYMKGMSGLYSRVPRYTVCSPYAMH